jgi:hypothetical protein
MRVMSRESIRTSTSHDHAVPDDECLYQVKTGEAVLERYGPRVGACIING